MTKFACKTANLAKVKGGWFLHYWHLLMLLRYSQILSVQFHHLKFRSYSSSKVTHIVSWFLSLVAISSLPLQPIASMVALEWQEQGVKQASVLPVARWKSSRTHWTFDSEWRFMQGHGIWLFKGVGSWAYIWMKWGLLHCLVDWQSSWDCNTWIILVLEGQTECPGALHGKKITMFCKLRKTAWFFPETLWISFSSWSSVTNGVKSQSYKELKKIK